MSDELTPALWVTGPAGVGKTTVAWELYADLVDSGVEVGYVDIDQLGMCFPEPESDPGRYRTAAQNLGSVVAGYRAAGARGVIVSGVVDPTRGVHLDRMPNVVVTTCRLRADADDLRRRLTARQSDPAYITRALAEADALDASDLKDSCIDTTGLPVGRVVALTRERTAGWMDPAALTTPAGVAGPPAVGDAAGGPILWLCGPTGVGKSSVGFNFFLRHVLGAKISGAFVDLDQIGFYRSRASRGVDHRMRAQILADMWRTFRAAGAECLTLVGPAEDATAISTYVRALPAATFTVCRLHATPEELAYRIRLRGAGGSWSQPGDPLKGQPDEVLTAAAERAAADAAALQQATVGDRCVDTTRRSVDDVADAILAETGWPAGGAHVSSADCGVRESWARPV
ncbi:hypothetical protein AB0A95_21555 [Micromonospora sp. NPDC049230]|uniref:hypothetical protein n=1 Tax=Micromonospora sp. NPDC049230 TaxID=3155502 RepID=UPI0033CF8616